MKLFFLLGIVLSSNFANAASPFKNIGSGLCWDESGASKSLGTPLLQYSCTSGVNQLFTLNKKVNGYFNIISKNSGHCVSPAKGALQSGTRLDLESCSSTKSSEEFSVQYSAANKSLSLVNHASGLCVDVPGSSKSSTQLQIYSCNGSAAQSFQTAAYFPSPVPTPKPTPSPTPAPTPVPTISGTVQSVLDQKCFNVFDGYTTVGNPIIQYDCDGGVREKFNFIALPSGLYQIQDVGSLKCLGVAATADGDKLNLMNCQNTDLKQVFRLTSSSLGGFNLNVEADHRCIDIPNSDTSNGTGLQEWTCNGSSAQAFVLPAGVGVSTSPTPTPVPTPTTAPVASDFGPGHWAANSPWKQVLPDNPTLDPNSAAMIQYNWSNGNSGGMNTTRVNYTDYGFPFYNASSSDPMVTYHCFEPWGTCHVEGKSTHMPANAVPAAPGDKHMEIIFGNQAFESYETPSGPYSSSLKIGWGTVTQLDGTGWPGDGVTAAGASGLAGIVTIAEFDDALSKNTYLNHALAMAPGCNGGVTSRYPATADAEQLCPNNGRSSNGIPLGARAWLDLTDAQVDALNLMPTSKVLLKTLHHFGGFMTDTNGNSNAMDIRNAPESWTSNPAVVPWAKQNMLDPWGQGTYFFDLTFKLDAAFWQAHLHIVDVSVTKNGTSNAN